MAVSIRLRRSTNFFCTGNRFIPWHLAMVLRNFACISWDYTVLQTYLARRLVIVSCFRIFFKLYPYVVLRTHKNISREVLVSKNFPERTLLEGAAGGSRSGAPIPRGSFVSKKKKKEKASKKKKTRNSSFLFVVSTDSF